MGYSIPVRVYIEDTDAGGIVYYVNYLKFMERVRTEWFRHLGFSHYTLAADDYQFVVHSCDVRYLQPARIDDSLQVSAEVMKLAQTYIDFKQIILREDAASDNGVVLCQGIIRIACVKSSNLKPRRMPETIYQAFSETANAC